MGGLTHLRIVLAALLSALLLGGCAGDGELDRSALRDLDDLSFEELIRLGTRFERAGDPGTAMRLYRQAAAREPERAEPLVSIGDLQLRAGNAAAARESYDRALARVPGHPGARLGLAQADLAQGRAQAALVRLEGLHGDGKESAESYNALGLARDLVGRHAQARAAYARALDLGANDPDVLTNLGLSLAVSGEREAALDLFRELEANSATRAQARENMALVLAMSGDIDTAVALAATAMPREAAVANRPFYRRLAELESVALARAVFLGELPVRTAAQEATPKAEERRTAAPAPGDQSAGPRAIAPADEAPAGPRSAAESGEAAQPAEDPAQPAETPPTPPAAEEAPGAVRYHLQLGAFETSEQVHRHWRNLSGIEALADYEPLERRVERPEAGSIYRLLIGPVAGYAAARSLCDAIAAAEAACLVTPEQENAQPLDRSEPR